jgi:hypothetical protein
MKLHFLSRDSRVKSDEESFDPALLEEHQFGDDYRSCLWLVSQVASASGASQDGCAFHDRDPDCHAISLCDLHAKYADVVKAVEVDAYMKSLPVGLFELPTGVPR